MNINIKSLTQSTTWTIILITILTIWSELSKPFKGFLTNFSGHHWVTKGIFSLVFFIILYFILSKIYEDSLDVKKETYYVVGATILGGLIIFIFFVEHFFS